MNIRKANKWDLPHIYRMLRAYRDAAPVNVITKADSEERIAKIFAIIEAGGGVCLIAEDEEPIGIIIGLIDQSIWAEEILMLRELAYWVDEEWRGTTAGYRLLSEYVKEGDRLVDEDRISLFTISKMVNSPDIKYEKKGFQKLEETWIKGEIVCQ